MKPKNQSDKTIKKELIVDEKLNDFLAPIFPLENDRKKFIKKCFAKLKTRCMLLHAHWYTEIADDMEKIRPGRPALKIIFLLAFAEYIAKLRLKKHNIQSDYAIKEFFNFISKEDKDKLIKNFRRNFLGSKYHNQYHNLRFSSIIRILYDVRNKAVHGEDFFTFLLKKESTPQDDYVQITSGELGKRGKKRGVSLEIDLTYEEIRDIIRRTAIKNIQSLF